MSSQPIAVTMGDPAGIGPEICLRLLSKVHFSSENPPLIYGDYAILTAVANQLKLPAPLPHQVLDLNTLSPSDFTPGVCSAKTGAAAYGYLRQAIDHALTGQVAAICTAPISKEALQAAGASHFAHTEILAEQTNTSRFCMLQVSEELSVSFVTTHIGYQEVSAHLTSERILEVIELTSEAMEKIRGRSVTLAVCGLNPHAGENGLFGNREEEKIITPAIEAARTKGICIDGPLPADTAFIPAKRKTTDAFICLYHDQGHIPLKALAFDTAVNTTLGLPIIRTSVDHGTACDIAWQGKANPQSLFAAFDLAKKLSL